jgi:hypothetical protein
LYSRLPLDEVKGILLLLYLLMVRMKLKLIEQRQEPLSLIDNFNFTYDVSEHRRCVAGGIVDDQDCVTGAVRICSYTSGKCARQSRIRTFGHNDSAPVMTLADSVTSGLDIWILCR